MPTWTRNRRWPLVVVVAAALAAALDAPGQEQGAKNSAAGAAATRDNPLVERWKHEAAEYRVVVQTLPETDPALQRRRLLSTGPTRCESTTAWPCSGWRTADRRSSRASSGTRDMSARRTSFTRWRPCHWSLRSAGGRSGIPRARGSGRNLSRRRPSSCDCCGTPPPDAEPGARIQGVRRPGEGRHRASATSAAPLSLRIEVRWRNFRLCHGDRSGSTVVDRRAA